MAQSNANRKLANLVIHLTKNNINEGYTTKNR